MRATPTSLALTLLAALLWPLAGAAALAWTLPHSRQPLAWALLAFVIVVALVRPLPLIDIVVAAAATVVFLLADAAQRAVDSGTWQAPEPAQAAVAAAVLLLTPWVVRLLSEDLSHLIARIEEQITRLDSLTMREENGIYRGRFLGAVLDEEITRARRYRRALMLGVIACDDWADIAEESGPTRTHEIVQTIEELLLVGVRPADKIVALGGGEWALVLPETSLDEASGLAARLQATLAGETTLAIRAGLADFPRDAVTRDGLLNEARQAIAFARIANLTVVDRTLLSEVG